MKSIGTLFAFYYLRCREINRLFSQLADRRALALFAPPQPSLIDLDSMVTAFSSWHLTRNETTIRVLHPICRWLPPLDHLVKESHDERCIHRECRRFEHGRRQPRVRREF